MNKADIVKVVSRIHGVKSVEASVVVDIVLNSIKSAVKSGRRCELRGFGSFIPTERCAYETTNPVTGQRMVTKPRRLMRFRPSQKFSDFIKSHDVSEVVK